ncbi:glycoside hydrolase family 18 protein [Hwangdonia lutea]|uniref:chitinase n=1 Tax=Hwangdonia lutea TaxID=3075823 RepID=A0AA97HR72_9FLAO|nr:glycoside hydrolase family 18 protein [Hwangdonia sp. SCSIO 19198]WOD44671.1 glycoside hydrolase family 18 protein [Hwangdonia sp. SCSIO 19198]
MKLIKYSIVFILSLSTSSINTKAVLDENQTEKPIAVMAYYVPEKDYKPETLPLNQLTHIIFSFTKVIDNEMKFNNDSYGEKLRQLVAQRKKHPNLKVMVACGGWAAKGFSDMAHTAETRNKFVESVVRFNKKYDLDGIDIDWEYPGIPAGNTKARPEDKQNFTLLMKELRKALNTLERTQTLTFASAGWKRYYNNIELNEVMKYVDFMNIMTYDQVSGNAPFTGHHTALGWIKTENLKDLLTADFYTEMQKRSAEHDTEYEPNSTEMIVDYCISKGVKPEQIVIGAAFYGKAWKGVSSMNNGLYQANKGAFATIVYRDIREKFESDKNYKRYWDSVAKAPYLFNASDSIFITFDDTVSVKLKTKYAKKEKLGGIMFWQLGQDVKEKSSLLNAIYTASKSSSE